MIKFINISIWIKYLRIVLKLSESRIFESLRHRLKKRDETALHDRRVKLYIKALKSSRSHQEENGLESLNLHSVPHIHPAIQHI